MDANQLQEILNNMQAFITQTQQQQQQFLTQMLNQQSTAQQQNLPTINITNIAPFEAFDSKKENFRLYRERFDNYLSMKNITSDEKRAQLLLNSIGAPNYNTLSALVAPKKPTEFSYSELIKKLEEHLAPARNTLVSQHHFLSKYQSNESIADYVATLRKELALCEFISKCECGKNVSVVETFLRAQFICGIRDQSITERLLQGNETDFNKIVASAISFEAAKADSRALSTKQDNNTTESINRLSRTPKRNFSFQQRTRSSSAQ